jgi:tetratricopeptide (TPR) repeat protein
VNTWPRRLITACVLLALVRLGGTARAAAPKWIELRSANFLLQGDVGERDLRDVARRLEEFRETLSRLLPKARLSTAAPTVVLVFGTNKGYEPFKPLYQGKPMKVTGFFQAGHDVNYVTMLLGDREDPYPIVFHEFTHLMLRATLGDTPLWFNEGLAEFYSSFEVSSDGKHAKVGKMIERHVLLLQERFMPLSDVLAADHTSALYNDPKQSYMMYAESWAWMHYLLHGAPKRTPQMFEYVSRLRRGTAREPAFREAFGAPIATLEQELRQYVQKLAFMSQVVTFTEPIAARVSGPTRPLTPAAAEARLGNLLLHMDRQDEGEARLKAALALDANDLQAHLTYGELCLRRGKPDEALTHLRAAAKANPDSFAAQQALGLALVRRVGPPEAKVLAEGRSACARALELQPESPDAMAGIAWTYYLAHERLDEAQRLAERAVDLAPSEPDHVLLLAQVLASRDDFAAARQRLGPLMASERPEVRDHARSLMGSIADFEVRMTAMRAAQNARGAARSESAIGRDETGAGVGGEMILGLRRLKDGEQRVFGALQRIECSADSTAFVVASGDRSYRFAAPGLDAVEFVSFRPDLKGNVACGPRQPPDPVYLTYRASPAAEKPPAPGGKTATARTRVDGEVVAIEFVPKDYVPKGN